MFESNNLKISSLIFQFFNENNSLKGKERATIYCVRFRSLVMVRSQLPAQVVETGPSVSLHDRSFHKVAPRIIDAIVHNFSLSPGCVAVRALRCIFERPVSQQRNTRSEARVGATREARFQADKNRTSAATAR